jgi:uncharacterized protein YbaP (TraB family)
VIFRRILALGLALVLSACGTEADKAKAPASPSKVALWEVSDASGPRAWIFGTVHALPPDTQWQRPAVAEALGKADRLVLEIGEDLNPELAGEALARLARTPGLPPPSQRIAPEHRRELDGIYQKLGLRDQTFPDMESWAVALQIAAIAGERSGIHAADGVEPELRRLAKGKPVIGLETIDGQFAIFDRLPQRQQTTLLEQTVAEVSSPEAEEQVLLAMWLRGDDLGIARESEKGFLTDGALRDALLTRRNQAWVGQVEALLQGGARPFIAVGAAHVAGRDGLPALLAARGWVVKRVP